MALHGVPGMGHAATHRPVLDTPGSLQPAGVQLLYAKAGAQREPGSSFTRNAALCMLRSFTAMLNLAMESCSLSLRGREKKKKRKRKRTP